MFKTSKYNCSNDTNFTYIWAQPAIFSKAALARVVNGFRLGGIFSICSVYKLYHDLAAGIFSWMYSLPSLPFGMRQCEFIQSSTYNTWVAKITISWPLAATVSPMNDNLATYVESMAPLHDYFERRANATWAATQGLQIVSGTM